MLNFKEEKDFYRLKSLNVKIKKFLKKFFPILPKSYSELIKVIEKAIPMN